MLLTTRCAGCSAAGAVLCRTCRFALVQSRRSARYGDVVVAASYTGRVRNVLLGCKFRNRRPVAAHLGGLLVRSLRRDGIDPGRIDCVTWAPTTRAHRRQRGFDQAELIARSAAAVLGVPCRRLLERADSDSQGGRTRRERLGRRSLFRIRPGAAALGTVLLVDDIVTTGATLAAAGAALRSAGVVEVIAAAVAATPVAVSTERATAA